MKAILRNAKPAARGRSSNDLSWEIPLAGGSLRVSRGRLIACCFLPDVVRDVILGKIPKFKQQYREMPSLLPEDDPTLIYPGKSP